MTPLDATTLVYHKVTPSNMLAGGHLTPCRRKNVEAGFLLSSVSCYQLLVTLVILILALTTTYMHDMTLSFTS